MCDIVLRLWRRRDPSSSDTLRRHGNEAWQGRSEVEESSSVILHVLLLACVAADDEITLKAVVEERGFCTSIDREELGCNACH